MNYGKKFEENVKDDWERFLPDSPIIRLQDQQSGYAGNSSNICDYIAFTSGKLFLLECKETKENTFNFAKLTQYDDLLNYKDYDNTYPGVTIWFSKHDKVVWVSINEIERMKKEGKKSVNIKMLDTKEYKIYEIPSKKKRVYLTCDFNILRSVEK